MFQDERLLSIMKLLQKSHRISIEEICEHFDVSRDTARRDIVKLEEQGKIIRTRGAAILPSLSKDTPNYEERMLSEVPSKKMIGKQAASMIMDGDYLFVDNSTTVRHAMDYMSTKNNVVITNAIDTAGLLTQKEKIKIYLLGGMINNEQRFVYGSQAAGMLAKYHVDKTFIGSCGISLDGLTTPYEEEVSLIQEAMKRADKVIVLADHSKFEKRRFFCLAGFENIHTIITDKVPETAIKEKIEDHGVELIIAK
ncbi:DeoR/GlpR family DNA-binding transcription regulator [Bacillus sp. FJAT-49736]|uniref:DeoR/GlpR family DNA-binding transcription regulator n=1 Tax=Bacillus sp. FJAT-49736 TaxID=2833582 RepID=UPI001BC9D89D|nr:DeoR/GlpR family DNA-binding transcription regulator [Bacillus sp. FJAT-49736]MBS4173049.1 DeoR/GlpR transcriptional regulator [Bacillus sp. FJAT-49736]